MKIKEPFHNNIIIKQEEIQKSSRILTPPSDDKPKIGKVIAVGPGLRNVMTGDTIPMQTKVGDIVAFPTFGGTKLEMDGEEYIILKDTDILTSLYE